jgi:hypothetical protein
MLPFERRLQPFAVPVSQHEVDHGDVNRLFPEAVNSTLHGCAGRDDLGARPDQLRCVIHRDHRFVFGDQDALAGQGARVHSDAPGSSSMRSQLRIPPVPPLALGSVGDQRARLPLDAPKLDLVRLLDAFHQRDDDVASFVLRDHDRFERLVNPAPGDPVAGETS